MRKILSFFYNKGLFVITLFLLAFIPLYPKRPLLDIQHTWVYVRVEDFVVAFVLLAWVSLLFLKKVTLKTPLTLPIIIFWIIGGFATLHGVLLIFPEISGVYSNVALLSFLRKIEYMSLFFVAYTAIKDKKQIGAVVGVLAIVLLLVVLYGFGQKFFGFPAFLTMNEEFAKGAPIQISNLSRVPSTFAGHYDLAAYLVLIIPLLTSVAIGIKNWISKIALFGVSGLGIILLFMTVSRVSVVVLLLSMGMMLLLQKKRLLLISLILINLLFLGMFPNLMQRFGNTVTEIDVLVDGTTGDAIGNVKTAESKVFENKTVVSKKYENNRAVYGINRDSIEEDIIASSSAVVPLSLVPQQVTLLVEPNAPTGEDLPQGTGYINLHLSPVKENTSTFYYLVPDRSGTNMQDRVVAFSGNFLVKRARAYDLSYTTRFQGEWPNTIEAFKRNIFLGSGFGSVSLAVDNNYLRILGEVGILGFAAFLFIFATSSIYIYKTFSSIDSKVTRGFVLGFVAGTFGLALNAILIDVFEASKIAFVFWLLMGITLATVHLYKTSEIHIFGEIKKLVTSTGAILFYLLLITLTLFFSGYANYFVGDDFTWLRWATDGNVANYFTQSDGFFYRPGTKLYFLFMYSFFWLNQIVYHFVSIFLHFAFAAVFFFTAKRILKDKILAAISAMVFLTLSGHAESVLWISSTGHLINALFIILSMLSFMLWKEKKKSMYLVSSVICIGVSLLFHELGVVAPLLIILYDYLYSDNSTLKTLFQKTYGMLFLPLIPYFFLRLMSGSHWFNGDYSYSLLKLPFNSIGNVIGYGLISIMGTSATPLYQMMRNVFRDNLLITLVFVFALLCILVVILKIVGKITNKEERKVMIFGILFFLISLLPFMGLGNIASRYSYLASAGLVITVVFLFKKMYDALVKNTDRNIALLSFISIAIVFVSVHLFQLQRTHSDWHAAGERAERFLISLNSVYSGGWTKEQVKFYFVDVPLRYGEAWIFPVGLQDAVWFVFRNSNIEVYQMPILSHAFNAIDDPVNQKVFLFNESGGFSEVIPPAKGSKE